ncbi:hypothetical protein M422DRAFT_149032 [Sphaerobolus stellatus SS14]|nr:hypothetical protein M422DRAFT_149032 [Sphaerobolus stellatus SS14]
MATPPDSVAPFTGTLLYPRDALISLARTILHAKMEHHEQLRDKAKEADDEAEVEDQDYNIIDVDQCIINVDGPNYRAQAERDDPEKEWDDITLRHFEDPQALEKELLKMDGKSEYVYKEAIQLRRDTREKPPARDPKWEKEDALLDFLQFLTLPGHGHLFLPGDMGMPVVLSHQLRR